MAKRALIVVTRDGLGHAGDGHEHFATEMLDKFFHTLESRPDKPEAICFYTRGVHCVLEDSPLRMGLELLAGLGVRMVVCGTCLDYYDVRDRVAVGEIGGMTEIVRLMEEADKVVTI